LLCPCFQIAIQAAVGGKIVARETVKAYRKDVTAKLVSTDPESTSVVINLLNCLHVINYSKKCGKLYFSKVHICEGYFESNLHLFQATNVGAGIALHVR
jgi:hypothetical protein